MSHAGTLIQSSVNDNICSQFVVCETCLWSAMVFGYVERQSINNNGNFQTCPICSVPNILLISITNEGVIFSLIRYNQEKYLLD